MSKNIQAQTITKADLTLQTVKAIIEEELRIVNLPLNETFRNLALSDYELDRVRQRLQKQFGKSTRALHSDTIYSYTDKLLSL